MRGLPILLFSCCHFGSGLFAHTRPASCWSVITTMGPPALGTPERAAYNHNQNARRIRLRKIKKMEKQRQAAKPFIAAATKTLQKQLDDETRRKNAYMRQLRHQTIKAQKSVDCATAVEKKMSAKEAKCAELKKELDELKSRLPQLDAASRRASLWETWWGRVSERASRSFKRQLHTLGRRPPPAQDGCWGGGQ